MVLWVRVPLHVDALLPPAEAPQGVICVVCDLQVFLGAQRAATGASPSPEGQAPCSPVGTQDRGQGRGVHNSRACGLCPSSRLTTPPQAHPRGPERGPARDWGLKGAPPGLSWLPAPFCTGRLRGRGSPGPVTSHLLLLQQDEAYDGDMDGVPDAGVAEQAGHLPERRGWAATLDGRCRQPPPTHAEVCTAPATHRPHTQHTVSPHVPSPAPAESTCNPLPGPGRP